MTVEELIDGIPMKRWFLAAKRLDKSSEEIMQDSPSAMIVAACEKAGQQDGNFDQYERFLDMSVNALSEFLTDDEQSN